jgi:thioredoxin 1
MAILTVTTENFDSILADNDLLAVDFWAPWCAPCVTFNAIIEKLAEKKPDLVFAKINIDEQPALAKEFDVQSVPAVLIVRSQVVVFAQSGMLPADALLELIEQAKGLNPADLKKED